MKHEKKILTFVALFSLVLLIPSTSADTADYYYSGAIDSGFYLPTPPVTITGNCTLAAHWQAQTNKIWDVLVMTEAQFDVWVLDRDNITTPAVERIVSSNNGTFLICDLDPSETYLFLVYHRIGGPFQSIEFWLYWCDCPSSAIPGFELTALLFGLFAGVMIFFYIRRSPQK